MSDISRKALIERFESKISHTKKAIEASAGSMKSFQNGALNAFQIALRAVESFPSTESEGAKQLLDAEKVLKFIEYRQRSGDGSEELNIVEQAIIAGELNSSFVESEGEALNQERYDQARKLVEGWNVWIDDKHLIYSVINRAIHLEREVARLSPHREDAETGVQKVREYYQSLIDSNTSYDIDQLHGMRTTLRYLGITIPGIKDGRDTDV